MVAVLTLLVVVIVVGVYLAADFRLVDDIRDRDLRGAAGSVVMIGAVLVIPVVGLVEAVADLLDHIAKRMRDRGDR